MQWPRFAKKQNPVMLPKAVTKPYSKLHLNKTNLTSWAKSPGNYSVPLTSNLIPDPTRFFKRFIQAITRFYPTASSAVWTWKNLCSTKQEVKFIGGTDVTRETAKRLVNDLDARVSPFKFVKGGGMDFLISQFFKSLFTYGRFAGNLNLDPNLNKVDKFEIWDPYDIRFTKDFTPYRRINNVYTTANVESFYYYGLDMDFDNPYGTALLEAAYSLMQMAEEMLQDMRLSSSNAGLPRLHMKIKQPPKLDIEDDLDYTERVNSYFDSYVDQLSDIAADDNFYTWDDVTIGVVGSQGPGGFVFKANRQIIDEEIISAFHLFPWILGKSASTTKNWVTSQYDLLLQVVESLQNEAKRFAEWIRNTELALNGITDVKAHHHFTPSRDPSAKDFAIAQRFKLSNVKTKILMGTISSDDGARELGYDKAHDPNLIFTMGKEKEEPINKEDRNPPEEDSLPSRLDEIEYKIDQILLDKEDTILDKPAKKE